MRYVNILTGGNAELVPLNLENYSGEWVGVDHGVVQLLSQNIVPTYAVGDFDSSSSNELTEIKHRVNHIIQASPIKDDTDTELGLYTVISNMSFDRIRIFGFSGGRVDHLLANLLMLMQPRFKKYLEQVELIDIQNQVLFYGSGNHEIVHQSGMKYLAFIALTPISSFSILDAKYQLDHQEITYPRAYVSNEFISSSVNFSLSDGIVATIQSRDLK